MKVRRESSTQDSSVNLQTSLGKLGSLDTVHKGIEEIKSYLTQYKKSENHISSFLNSLSPTNEHMLTQNHKKELIKLYGLLAEMLEENCMPYLSRMVSSLLKKLKEANTNLNEAISQAYGAIIHNTLHTLPDLPSSCSQLAGILKPLFENISSTNKVLQVGSAGCITKIIQHSPIECLRYMLETLSLKLIQFLSTSKAQTQIIESLISLILSVEQEFEKYTAYAVPELLNCIANEDFACRKQVIDALYTLGAVVPEAVRPFAREVLTILGKVRADKIKPVRDSAVEATNLYKKLVVESPPKPAKIEPKINVEENKPKSIFRGPVNTNFFQAAKNLNDSIVEAPERSYYKEAEKSRSIPVDSPRSFSPSFKEQDNSKIEKFYFEESVREEEKFGDRAQNALTCCREIQAEFRGFKEQTRSELFQINQRLGALEEMITTVSQLFDAKIKQITCHPSINQLLRN